MEALGGYCASTKAIQHLGDRWSLLIVSELGMRGALGFNALADVLPGISRSVLTRRLRKLEVLGLACVTHWSTGDRRRTASHPPASSCYRRSTR